MSTEDKIAYIAVTKNGKQLALRLKKLVGQGDIYITSKLQGEEIEKQETKKVSNKLVTDILANKKQPQDLLEDIKESIRPVYELPKLEQEDIKSEHNVSKPESEKTFVIEGSLGTFMKQLFEDYDYLICIMATGIVVRSIAPYVVSKFKDPAVIVMDEKGKHVISLLSGHMGGANEMTRKISTLIKADPVITTATDTNEKAALDCMIKELNAYTENLRESVKAINYGLVNEEKIGLYIQGDYEVDERGFIRLDGLEEETLQGKLKEMERVVYVSHEAGTCICHDKLIKVVPRRFVLGVGCKKHTSTTHMLEAFEFYMKKHGLDPRSISLIGSIELKKDEEAIKALAKQLEVPFEVLSKEAISEVEGLFEGSSFVKKNVGVTCVAEPAAYLLGEREIILPKEKYEGITFALGVAAKAKLSLTDLNRKS